MTVVLKLHHASSQAISPMASSTAGARVQCARGGGRLPVALRSRVPLDSIQVDCGAIIVAGYDPYSVARARCVLSWEG
jgi:hypothetical protein